MSRMIIILTNWCQQDMQHLTSVCDVVVQVSIKCSVSVICGASGGPNAWLYMLWLMATCVQYVMLYAMTGDWQCSCVYATLYVYMIHIHPKCNEVTAELSQSTQYLTSITLQYQLNYRYLTRLKNDKILQCNIKQKNGNWNLILLII